ncbi:MAG: hypothetical protein RR636_00175 [Clostridium sp.]|uniref:hypothetical protein n=1 Tax=Clostridium sp. TaxID=1506 RepID=UPI003042EB16
MKVNEYKLINVIILILIPVLIGCYFMFKNELSNLIVNVEAESYIYEKNKNKFELATFLSKLDKYENINIDNITFYDDWGELKIEYEGDLNDIRELLNSLKSMKEIKDIVELSIENSRCELLVMFNR